MDAAIILCGWVAIVAGFFAFGAWFADKFLQ